MLKSQGKGAAPHAARAALGSGMNSNRTESDPAPAHDRAATPQGRAANAPGHLASFADYLHREPRPLPQGTAYAPAIHPTSIYALDPQPAGPYQYARWANPGWTALESALGELEQAQCVAFPSGAAAVHALLEVMLAPQARLLVQSDGYMGTRSCAEKYFVPWGVRLEALPSATLPAADLAGASLVLVETPSNPGLVLTDIAALAARCRQAGARLAIDNTLMSPLGQSPLDLGATATVYSDTKVLNGHSDLVMGHVSTRDPALAEALRQWRRVAGAIPGPFEAWQLLRGIETLELRLERMHANALALAGAMSRHPAVRSLRYPGLPDHPDHALACRQMRGFGALLAVELAGAAEAEAFLAACRYVRPTTSFGGLHSSAERRARWGDAVAPGFVRLSAGCEPTQALVSDVCTALDAARS
jgi:cystathionine gamma-lyase